MFKLKKNHIKRKNKIKANDDIELIKLNVSPLFNKTGGEIKISTCLPERIDSWV